MAKILHHWKENFWENGLASERGKREGERKISDPLPSPIDTPWGGWERNCLKWFSSSKPEGSATDLQAA